MARTPKAAPASSPTPAPRGRKPKLASAAMPTLDTTGDPAEKEGASADFAVAPAVAADSTPTRGRPGRKPKIKDGTATPALIEQALEQQPEPDEERPDADRNDTMIAEMAYPDSDGEGGSTSERGPVQLAPAQEPLAQDTHTAVKPAARWDKATDEVQFDWPAIERAAAQSGPNQVMAKLLIAARAEAANSRWPL